MGCTMMQSIAKKWHRGHFGRHRRDEVPMATGPNQAIGQVQHPRRHWRRTAAQRYRDIRG